MDIPETLPKAAYEHKEWTYHPLMVRRPPKDPNSLHRATGTATFTHWVRSPDGTVLLMPHVKGHRAERGHFHQWVNLGSPTAEELGGLISDVHRLRMYRRKLANREIIAELSKDEPMPPPEFFGVKGYTNHKFLKALLRLKEQYGATNMDLPVLAKMVEKKPGAIIPIPRFRSQRP